LVWLSASDTFVFTNSLRRLSHSEWSGRGTTSREQYPVAHELRNEAVEELTPDLVGESRAELKVELMRDGRNNGMEGEKGRR